MDKEEIIFICSKCGEINEVIYDIENIKEYEAPKCKCGKILTVEERFWNISFLEMKNTLNTMYNLCNEKDKDNKKNIYEYLIKNSINTNQTEIDACINLYEEIRNKNKNNANNVKVLMDDMDEFEEKLLQKGYGINKATAITASIQVFHSNEFRKIFVITLASLLEQFYYDYFKALVVYNLGENKGKLFMKQYENAGIQSLIELSNIFLEEKLVNRMDRTLNGFYNKWAKLRSLRNCIIHNNDVYISKIKIKEMHKMFLQVIPMFVSLKGNIYSN